MLARPPVVPALAQQRIYFVMPDRYADGDPANDRGGLTGPSTVTGFDPAASGWFHGGDLKGLTGDCADPASTGLPRIKGLGFTALWTTPVLKQKTVQGSSAAYHGYWGLDFTTVDPHLGSDADFAALVQCAHSLGLKVYLDVVVNHTADVILPQGGSTYSDLPYRDCRGRVFDPARYATGTAFPCLAATQLPHVPLVLPADKNAKKPAWLNDPLRYHNRGDVDFASCSAQCFEQGDFYGLDDLFTEQPAVVDGLAKVYGSWITRFKVDGFRIDTAKHVNAAFFRVWVPKIRAAARTVGIADFALFGEVTLTDPAELSRFVLDRGLPGILDFPFQQAAAGFASGTSGRGLAAALEDADYYRLASGEQPANPTFLGNHDMGRGAQQIASRAAGELSGLKPAAAAARLAARVQLGTDLLYLLPGAPIVDAGDEVGMLGSGGDKAARQDMSPTQVPDWQTEARVGGPPIGKGSSFAVTGNPIGLRLKALSRLRDDYPALATAPVVVRLATEPVLVVSRIDPATRRELLVAFNAGATAAKVTVTTSTPAASWTRLLGSMVAPVSGTDGQLALTLRPLSSLVLRSLADLPPRPATAPELSAGPDDYSSLFRLVADTAGDATVAVTFAYRPPGALYWRRIATDDSSPYRAFLAPARFHRGETVDAVAIARALDGSTAVSAVVQVTPRPAAR